MVATRRGARTGADNDAVVAETASNIRKKPVRRTATKSVAQKPAPTKKITRATRSQKQDENTQDDGDDGAEGSEEEVAQAPRTRQTARSSKTEAATKQSTAKKPTVVEDSTRATRTTSTRTRKAGVLSDNVQNLQPGPKSRNERTTRAAAAKDIAKVLSPKKVTQVSKVQPRAMKSSVNPISSKLGSLKTTGPIRSTRRRAVSDENTDVSTTTTKDRKEESDVRVETAKPKFPKSSKPSVVIEIDSDSEMSSRPTTPADSPEIDVSRSEEDVDESKQTHSDAELTESEVETSDDSGDELCGPKTPMKRCSPREAARYQSSPQRSVRQIHDKYSIRTPTRNTSPLRMRMGTPQTQRERIRVGSAVPYPEPMTVARAFDRAMVFPDLTAMSVVPSLHSKVEPVPELEEREHDLELELEPGNMSHESESPSQPSTESFDHTEPSGPSEILNSLNDINSNDAFASVNELADNDDAFEFEATPCPRAEEDGQEIFEDDESVIISSNRQALEQSSPTAFFDNCLLDMTAQTPKPETLIWENIRQDETLLFDLPNEGDSPDTLPEPDQTEILSPVESFTSEGTEDVNDFENAEQNQAMISSHGALQSPGCQQSRLSLNGRPSLDASIHLSQFIDVQSLSERVSDLEAQHLNDMDVELDLTDDDKTVVHSTPVKDSAYTREFDPIQVVIEPSTPRYAHPTMSSASKRRKSLPAFNFTTPIKAAARPKTADGAVVPRPLANENFQCFNTDDPFSGTSSADPALEVKPVTPVGKHDNGIGTVMRTPQARNSGLGMTSATTPRPTRPAVDRTLVPQTVAGQRHIDPQARVSRELFHAPHSEETPAPPTIKAQQERYPGLPSRSTYDELAQSPLKKNKSDEILQTPKTIRQEQFANSTCSKPTEKLQKTPIAKPTVAFDITTPISSKKERYPGLPSRKTYEEHAKTAIIPTRFRTPLQVPAKRPASAMKASSFKELARTISRNPGTPIKTPLKPPGMTPGQVPMTPHPAAPLKGVYALVDVWTNDASPASSAFIALLQRLGAKTTKSWSKRLTHVVFKSGSPTTLQRLRQHNREVEQNGTGTRVLCVNSRWVTDCDSEGHRADETDEEYAVDVEEECRGSKRRRKSMEPAALVNLGDNVIRDRRSSLGRASLGRLAGASPVKKLQLQQKEEVFDRMAEKENAPDVLRDEEQRRGFSSSPETPAYLAAPETLVQQTAPINKVRKLDLGAKVRGKDRRMTTVWDLEF